MQYPALSHLIGGYFHQDWPEESGSLEGVLDDYSKVHDAHDISLLIDDAERFRLDNDSDLLANFERGFEPNVIIGRSDDEAREWFDWLIASLADRLERAARSAES